MQRWKGIALAASIAISTMSTNIYAEGTLRPSSDAESVFTQKQGNESITWNDQWQFADYSKIHASAVTLYRAADANGIVVAVNAGHGTSGGESVQTQCHPDGSAKVTGGSTGAGALYAASVSSGTSMLDGTSEAVVNLSLAVLLKDKLLASGYDVLMIREDSDVQLDNIARTVLANNNASCHVAIHYDSSENDKGFFYIGVPEIESYRGMFPVSEMWQEHMRLGDSILKGMTQTGNKIYGEGMIPLDLTQTSYSTVPSVDVEVGDRGSDYSEAVQERLAEGIKEGIDLYFGVEGASLR